MPCTLLQNFLEAFQHGIFGLFDVLDRLAAGSLRHPTSSLAKRLLTLVITLDAPAVLNSICGEARQLRGFIFLFVFFCHGSPHAKSGISKPSSSDCAPC